MRTLRSIIAQRSLPSILSAACLLAACSDVGDDGITPGNDASATDGTSPADDGEAQDSSSPAVDGGAPDAEPIEDATASVSDADATASEPDANVPDGGELDVAETGTIDTGVLDTGVVDTGVLDTGVLDTGVVDAGVDATMAEAGVDAGPGEGGSEEGGGPSPCTSSGQTGCIPCDGTTSGANAGLCSPEEAIFVEKDIQRHLYSGLQLNKTGAHMSCYECLASNGCVDTNVNHGSECGDLNGTIGAGASMGKTLAQACIDTLTCIESSTGSSMPAVTPATDCANDSNNGGANCYCGPAFDDSTSCDMAAASAVNGPCVQAEVSGFGATTSTPPSTILGEFTDVTTASGMANNILNCAGANSGVPECPQCL